MAFNLWQDLTERAFMYNLKMVFGPYLAEYAFCIVNLNLNASGLLYTRVLKTV